MNAAFGRALKVPGVQNEAADPQVAFEHQALLGQAVPVGRVSRTRLHANEHGNAVALRIHVELFGGDAGADGLPAALAGIHHVHRRALGLCRLPLLPHLRTLLRRPYSRHQQIPHPGRRLLFGEQKRNRRRGFFERSHLAAANLAALG